MATRWRHSLWVLAGLVLTVVALWDDASVPIAVDGVAGGTETVDSPTGSALDGSAPSGLAFDDRSVAALANYNANLLRPSAIADGSWEVYNSIGNGLIPQAPMDFTDQLRCQIPLRPR